MALKLLAELLGVLYCCSALLAVNPGFRIVITSRGLDYVLKVGIPILEDALAKTSIPDQSGKAGTPIGHVKYSLEHIKLSPLSIPSSSLTSGSDELELKASGIKISAKGDWRYEQESFPYIKDHGSAHVSASSVSLSVKVTLGADKGGHPTLSSHSCSLHIEHLDVHFDGGSSWLYNLFADNIAGGLKGSLEDELCKDAVKEINTDGNKALETLPVEVKLDETAMVNYALVGSPVLDSSYVETNHKGEFMSVVKPVEAPLTVPALPKPSKTDRMAYVWFTDYVANTAGFVYQAGGSLAYNVTPDMIPSGVPFKLNTASFKLVLPQLYKTYPNMNMVLFLHAPKPPNMVISESSINLTVPAYVNMSVIDPSSNQTKPACTLDVLVYCSMTVSVKAKGGKEVVSGNATFLRATISLVSSQIGNFEVSALQSFVNTLSTAIILPVLNGYANTGIEIPIFDGVSFVNATISLGDHFVMVSSDIHYKPTFRH